MTNAKLMEIILHALPNVEELTELDFDTEEHALRFAWNGEHFRVSHALTVQVIKDGTLQGDHASRLMEALIMREGRKTKVDQVVEQPRPSLKVVEPAQREAQSIDLSGPTVPLAVPLASPAPARAAPESANGEPLQEGDKVLVDAKALREVLDAFNTPGLTALRQLVASRRYSRLGINHDDSKNAINVLYEDFNKAAVTARVTTKTVAS